MNIIIIVISSGLATSWSSYKYTTTSTESESKGFTDRHLYK